MVSEEEVAIAQAQAVINENCNDEILKMDTSDGGNADAFAVEHSDDFIYVREIGWLRYNGSYWQHDDGAVMLAMRKSIEDFMATVLTKEGEKVNQELVDFMQTALGYSMTGHTKEEKLFYLFGSLGRNGKGSITETMMALVPYPIAQEVDFNTFVAKRDGSSQNFDLADMKASRLLFASESNKYQQLNPASIKKLTGGNYVRAAHKFKGFFAYRPQYKVWLSSNHNVNGDPDDNAMWNRVGIVELPNSYIDRENKNLKTGLQSVVGLTGLLRWLVIGSMRWYASEDGLVIPEQVKRATRNQREKLDTFDDWLKDVSVADRDNFSATSDLTQNYKVWCEINGVTPKGRNQFSDSMQVHGYKPTKSNNIRGYRLVSEYRRLDRDRAYSLCAVEDEPDLD